MIGKKIYALRKSKGMSLGELAIEAGVSKSYLWGIEKDKISPSHNKIVNISKVLAVSVSFLIDDSKTKVNQNDVLYIKFNRLSETDKLRILEIMDLWSKE